MIDVAERFKFFFDGAFFLSSIQLVAGSVGMMMEYKRNWQTNLLKLSFWLANVLIFGIWIYAFFVRYMHSGQECSGDLIIKKTEAKYLLYMQGTFLKFTSLFFCFIVVLIGVGHCLNYL